MAGPQIDVQLLNPFVDATLDCLRDMGGWQPKRKQIFMRKDRKMYGDICGIIGMSNGVCGSCTVSFPLHLAEQLVGNILGESCAGDAEMVKDGIGEVANMVAGGAKRRFDATTFSFDISTPIVLLASGGDLEMYNPHELPGVCCEFLANESDGDSCFLIEIAIQAS